MSCFFSIILPTYNRATHLSNAIQSVRSQFFENWELIIVDDGSTDNTKEIVNQFQDERIRYIFQQNAERSAARNNGIRNSKGEWICFLDSDDEYLPNHLVVLHESINKSSEVALYVTGNLIRTGDEIIQHPQLDLTQNVCKEIWSKFILMNSVCAHKSVFNQNNFDERFNIWEDTHLWLRISCKFPIIQIPIYTCVQNVTNDSSVKKGFEIVNLENVNRYIHAIRDLQVNYSELIKQNLETSDFKNYISKKYSMYLYQARQNKQLVVAFQIWVKAIILNPSFFLVADLPKILLNRLNIGIHEK